MQRAPIGGKSSLRADRLQALLWALILLAADPRRLAAAPQEELRRALGISNFKPPPRWEVRPQDQPTYPQLLAWASRGQGPDQSVMTLVFRRLMSGTSVQTFANESAAVKNFPGLSSVRLQTQSMDGFGGRRVQLDGVLEGAPRRIVRQIFLTSTRGDEGYVLTLMAPQAQALARLRDFEDTAARLTDSNPAPPSAAPTPVLAPALPTPAPLSPPASGAPLPSEGPR